MVSFVDVIPFFHHDEERTIERLAKVYNDRALLYSSVKMLFDKHLNPSDISGKRVLLKPNLVKQNKTAQDEICLRTNDNLMLETVHALLEFGPKELILGDAPIQDCVWDELFPKSFYDELKNMSDKFGIPVRLVDFRRHIFYTGSNKLVANERNEGEYLIFDLGKDSFLEPITTAKKKFRVTNYNPDRMSETHGPGMHKYCIRRDLFDCDTVITMPKIKTHRMACLTNSLKILVGINGDKDYLPHHRLGSVSCGGDCYKKFNLFRTISEKCLDFANRHQGTVLYKPWLYGGLLLWNLSMPNQETMTNAGWYGNDTVWRMVLDLNKVAVYGRNDGTIAETPQRTLYTLVDGIIGGQGSGPLYPDPLALGILAFSNDSYLMDEVGGYLYRLIIDKVPLLKEAKRMNDKKQKEFFLNGETATLEQIKAISTDAILAPGWVNYNKK
jgi:uncharacterized protein (DUF362 family)